MGLGRNSTSLIDASVEDLLGVLVVLEHLLGGAPKGRASHLFPRIVIRERLAHSSVDLVMVCRW